MTALRGETIEGLLAESQTLAKERQRTTFATQLAGTDASVVLFGAGRLGRLCARALQRGGIALRAFCDGNRKLHGTSVEGVPVLSLEEAVATFGASSLFVVAIWTGTARESMIERLAYLRCLGARVAVPYPALVWAHGREETPFHSFDLPSRILAAGPHLRKLAELLADESSRETLRCALRQRLLGEFSNEPPAPDQYFPTDVVALSSYEIFVDGGAYTGDTLETFINRTDGRFTRYHAFEPDPETFGRLHARVVRLPKAVRGCVTLHNAALMERTGRLVFASNGTIASSVSAAGISPMAARQVDVVADNLDERLPSEKVTFLKLDVEGAERAALEGAVRTLRREQPQAAVCVYHRPRDLWEIPLLLRELLPQHRLHLRQHGIDGWETVCYAVPASRSGDDNSQ